MTTQKKQSQSESANKVEIFDFVEGKGIRIVGPEALVWMKVLVNRGMANWDRAPWELKAFADMFISEHVQQDYFAQDPLNSINLPPPERT